MVCTSSTETSYRGPSPAHAAVEAKAAKVADAVTATIFEAYRICLSRELTYTVLHAFLSSMKNLRASSGRSRVMPAAAGYIRGRRHDHRRRSMSAPDFYF